MSIPITWWKLKYTKQDPTLPWKNNCQSPRCFLVLLPHWIHESRKSIHVFVSSGSSTDFIFIIMGSKTTMVAEKGICNRYLQMNFRHISLYDSHKGHNFLLVSYRKRFSDYSLGIPARHHLAIYNSFKSSRTRTPMLVSAVRLYRSVINCTESERNKTVGRWIPFFLCSHQQPFLASSQVLSVSLESETGD